MSNKLNTVEEVKYLNDLKERIARRSFYKNCGSYRQIERKIDKINQDINKLLGIKPFNLFSK